MLTKILIPVLAFGLTVGFTDEAKMKKLSFADGKKTYQTFCITCHGAKGKGDGPAGAALKPKPRNFTDTAFISKESKQKMYNVISEGGKKNGLSPMMAPWKGSLKPDQINNVLAFVLTFGEDSTKAMKDVEDKGKEKAPAPK